MTHLVVLEMNGNYLSNGNAAQVKYSNQPVAGNAAWPRLIGAPTLQISPGNAVNVVSVLSISDQAPQQRFDKVYWRDKVAKVYITRPNVEDIVIDATIDAVDYNGPQVDVKLREVTPEASPPGGTITILEGEILSSYPVYQIQEGLTGPERAVHVLTLQTRIEMFVPHIGQAYLVTMPKPYDWLNEGTYELIGYTMQLADDIQTLYLRIFVTAP